MQIPYTPVNYPHGTTVYLPLVIVEFIIPWTELNISPELIRPTKALVDSGADGSLFDIEILERIGIPRNNLSPITCWGAGAISFQAWHFPIKVRFPQLSDREIDLQAHWCDMRYSSAGVNLLGRSDFFSQFQVLFSERKKLMDIYPYKS